MTATLTDTTVLDELDDTIPCEDPRPGGHCGLPATQIGRCVHVGDGTCCRVLLLCDEHAALVKRVLCAWLAVNRPVLCIAHLRVSVLTWEPLR